MTADLEKLVKPLVWTKHPKIDGWRCDTIVGTYKVFGIGPTPSWDFDGLDGEARSCVAGTIEAAKAAAQADYARRIAAALDPDAIANMVQEAVKAEREACARMIEDAVIEGRRDVALAGKRPSYADEKAVEMLMAFTAAIRARGEA